jgi:Ala-tRNA(Pro) deacylase
LDEKQLVKVLFDNELTNLEYPGVSDGTTTGYMKIKTAPIIEQFLPYTEHPVLVVDL